MASFGKTLKSWREEKGWSQQDLAEKMDVKSGKQTISRWELGKAEPALSELRKIAELFEKTVAQLLGESEPDAPKETREGYITVPLNEFIELQRRVIKQIDQPQKPDLAAE